MMYSKSLLLLPLTFTATKAQVEEEVAVSVDTETEIINLEKIDRILASCSIADVDFCRNGENCASPRCRGCGYSCSGQCSFPTQRCLPWCEVSQCDLPGCSECKHCNEKETRTCPLGKFQDSTQAMFSGDPTYWYSPVHSGFAYKQESSPLYVDLDADGYLDYFNSLHGHKIVNGNGDLNGRMELALTKPSPSQDGKQTLASIADRIIFEDDPEDFANASMNWIDTHGSNILDLDGDGILDLFISQGGYHGLPIDNPAMFDSFLLFGEKNEDGDVVFRGGRSQAAKSGVNMRHGRGRTNYMLDVNGDGLIDIFAIQSRRKDNTIAPGVLLINQGDRTWKPDTSMMEYATSMIVTDADGDGVANEVMISRGFCFPQRSTPDIDEDYKELGIFNDEVKDFCKTRPVGTTAIYKWNDSKKKMVEISPNYFNISSDSDKQPPCCPHGLHDGSQGCSATSIATADLDGDKLADQVFLYWNRLDFYFSSDRASGQLPIASHSGLSLELPAYCGGGESVRILDLNNSGFNDILVLCRNPGAFVFFTNQHEKNKKNWKIRNECGANDSMGDITDASLASPNMDELFRDVDCKTIEYKHLKKICQEYQQKGKTQMKGATGISTVDLDNNGRLDLVVSHTFGYLRFYYNEPTEYHQDNKFIVFKLKGNGITSNIYGIGATVILTTFNQSGKQKKILKEISSFQHTSENAGYQDDRIIFGLGQHLNPSRVEIIWPSSKRQVMNLEGWKFDKAVKPILIEDYTETASSYFSLRFKGPKGKNMCISAGEKIEWTDLFVVECMDDSLHQQFRLDKKGQLRSLKFVSYCVTVGERSNFSNLKLGHCTLVTDSWHQTSENYITLNGSGKGITVADGQEKDKLYLYDASEENIFIQKWERVPTSFSILK